MRKLTHREILSLREKNRELNRTPIVICLNDVRSLYNVGSIFRIADGIRAEKIYLCGITGRPPSKAITKSALGAEESVPWVYEKNISNVIQKLKSSGYQIVVMEHTTGSIDYSEAEIKFPACLIVGNEVSGVDSDIVSQSDLTVEIPMLGEKNSLNVGVAAGVVLYRFLESLTSALPTSKREKTFDFFQKNIKLDRF